MSRKTTDRLVLALVAVAAVVLAVCRAIGVRSPGFQADAHLFVGALFVAWAAGGGRVLLLLALGLTAVEGVCFFLTRS